MPMLSPLPSRFWRWLLSILFAFLVMTPPALAEQLRLALANSTCEVMKKIGAVYQASTPVDIDYNCKSSGLLAKGMRGGALHADIFVSADQEWMDFAVENALIDREQVSSPWGNRLVVAVSSANPLQLNSLQDLASEQVTDILIGDPSTAPFGRYAKEALESAGLWVRIKDKIATRKNITLLAESLAEKKTGTAGIMFRTNLNQHLQERFAIDTRLHKPIRYFLAPLKQSASKQEVRDFLKFLQSRTARQIFMAERFELTGH